MSSKRRVVEGVLRNMKSERSDCICCDGPHIFAYGIEIETRGVIVGSVDEWIHEQLSPVRDRDGIRVRVTLDIDVKAG